MSFTTINYSLDLLVLSVMVVFLLTEKPVRVAAITLIYLASHLLPVGLLESGIPAPTLKTSSLASPSTLLTPTTPVASSNAEMSPSAPPLNPLQAANTLADVSQALGAAIGDGTPVQRPTSALIPNAGSTPGAEKTTSVGASPSASSFTWSNGPASYLNYMLHPAQARSLRYGRDLSTATAEMVERLWFYARMCMLFALIPFFVADPKITMGIGSLMALPVPYLIVLAHWAWQKLYPSTSAHSPSDQVPPLLLAILAVFVSIVIGQAGYAWWRPHRQRTEVFVPDPENYRVCLMGQTFDFKIEGTTLRLLPGEIELDLARASSPPEDPRHFQFLSGTEIDFVPRPPEST